jgi:glycerophosphoryl diester phosphodiesterase
VLARPLVVTAGALLGISTLCLPAAAQPAGETDEPTVVAHRGASGYAPENTLQAVEKANNLDITWVENDVQRTRDGALVVIHDTDLKRTTDVEEVFPDRSPWKVADFTLDEIRQLDAGSWFSPAYAGARVPTLEEYLETVRNNGQSLLMELKAPQLYPGIEQQVLNELREEGWLDPEQAGSKLVIQSFSADSVKAVHALRPDVKTGFLGRPTVADLPKFAQFTDQINPPHGAVTPEYVTAVHSLKGPRKQPMEVFTWTVNDSATAVRLTGYGVDGIITNYADVIRDAMSRGSSGNASSATNATDDPGSDTSDADDVGFDTSDADDPGFDTSDADDVGFESDDRDSAAMLFGAVMVP